MIKKQVLTMEVDDLAAYQNEVEDAILAHHETPKKRPALDNSSVSPIAINSTAMETHM
jgi:hypothetical protein